MQQLLLVETILKGAVGIVLFLVPGLFARAVGLPHAGGVFWARIAAALLIGIAAAAYVEGAWPKARGIGLGGLAALNLVGAALLLIMVSLGRAAETSRGAVAIAVLAVGLVVLALIEVVVIKG